MFFQPDPTGPRLIGRMTYKKLATKTKRPDGSPASTPTRPFKRFREALSPRSPRTIHEDPSPRPQLPLASPEKHLPLCPSPSLTITSPLPDDLETVLREIQAVRSHLDQPIAALGRIVSEHSRATELAEQEKEREKKKHDDALAAARRDIEEYRASLKSARADKGRAATEAQGLIAHLEKRLEEEKSVSAQLHHSISEIKRESRRVEETSDMMLFELQQRLDQAQQEKARAEEEKEALRVRLEEAEFTHRALKESGARLQRELESRGGETPTKGRMRGGRV